MLGYANTTLVAVQLRFRHRRMEVRENGVASFAASGNHGAKASEEELGGDGHGEEKDEAEDEVAAALFQPGFWTKLIVVR